MSININSLHQPPLPANKLAHSLDDVRLSVRIKAHLPGQDMSNLGVRQEDFEECADAGVNVQEALRAGRSPPVLKDYSDDSGISFHPSAVARSVARPTFDGYPAVECLRQSFFSVVGHTFAGIESRRRRAWSHSGALLPRASICSLLTTPPVGCQDRGVTETCRCWANKHASPGRRVPGGVPRRGRPRD